MSGTMGLMRYNNRERISRHLTTFFSEDEEVAETRLRYAGFRDGDLTVLRTDCCISFTAGLLRTRDFGPS